MKTIHLIIMKIRLLALLIVAIWALVGTIISAACGSITWSFICAAITAASILGASRAYDAVQLDREWEIHPKL